MQKIVFNGHYLTYIDTAIAEYWRAIGLPYPQGYVERYGTTCTCARPPSSTSARRATTTSSTVCCRVAKLGRTSMTFHFEIYREARTSRWSPPSWCTSTPIRRRMKAAPLPDDLRARVLRYERVSPQA